MIDVPKVRKFPLYDLNIVRFHESEIVLSGSISQHNTMFEAYLDGYLDRRSRVEFAFEQKTMDHTIEVSSGRDWHEHVCRDVDFIYSSDLYFAMDDLRGYSSGRDSVSVIAFGSKFSGYDDIFDWDRYFASHLREVGVGFGEEGLQYAKHLIGQLPSARSRLLMAALQA